LLKNLFRVKLERFHFGKKLLDDVVGVSDNLENQVLLLLAGRDLKHLLNQVQNRDRVLQILLSLQLLETHLAQFHLQVDFVEYVYDGVRQLQVGFLEPQDILKLLLLGEQPCYLFFQIQKPAGLGDYRGFALQLLLGSELRLLA